MCKKCSKLAGIGKPRKKSRIGKMKYSVNSKSIVQRVAAAGVGLVVGNYVAPEITKLVDKDGTGNKMVVPAIVTAVGVVGAMKTKGLVSDVMVGVAAGGLLELIGSFTGIDKPGASVAYYDYSAGSGRSSAGQFQGGVM